MKILWVHNIAIPKIAKDANLPIVPVGGWMVKLADMISAQPGIELYIAFPCDREIEGSVDKIKYYSFKVNDKNIYFGTKIGQNKRIENILKSIEPDCIHIFGTEKLHSYLFTKEADRLEKIKKVVISIQGMTSVYARHYEAFLPQRVIFGFSLRDLVKGNVLVGKIRFMRLGKLEKETIQKVSNVIGRTDWDRACTYFINPKVKYYVNNEMLRDGFYFSKPWSYNNCVPHSVFISQATQPLKGLHIAIEAISILKPFYPDIKLRIAGKSYTKKKFYKLSKYEQYILKIIKKYDLGKNIEFTGFLDENQMVEEYKQCNAFVCSSSIENSPNSLCEAMLLGVPIVTSLTGGIENLIKHNEEGFIYQPDAPYMLAFYLKTIFDNREKIESVGMKAREAAFKRHDPNKVVNELIDIYNSIGEA